MGDSSGSCLQIQQQPVSPQPYPQYPGPQNWAPGIAHLWPWLFPARGGGHNLWGPKGVTDKYPTLPGTRDLGSPQSQADAARWGLFPSSPRVLQNHRSCIFTIVGVPRGCGRQGTGRAGNRKATAGDTSLLCHICKKRTWRQLLFIFS